MQPIPVKNQEITSKPFYPNTGIVPDIWNVVASHLPVPDLITGLKCTNSHLFHFLGNDPSYWTSAIHRDFPHLKSEGLNHLEKYKLCRTTTTILLDIAKAEKRLLELRGPNGNDGLIHQAWMNIKQLKVDVEKKREPLENHKRLVVNDGDALINHNLIRFNYDADNLLNATHNLGKAEQSYQNLKNEMNRLANFNFKGEIVSGRIYELRIKLEKLIENHQIEILKHPSEILNNLNTLKNNESKNETGQALSSLDCTTVAQKTFEKTHGSSCSIL